MVRLNPYINFRNNAREAMEFYKSVFGGNLMMNTYKEFHASTDPTEDDKIMHAMLEAQNGIVFMAADTPNNMQFVEGRNVHMSLSGEDESTLRGYWDLLSVDGSVVMPLEKAPWGDIFGMVNDKFGVSWMVNISGKKS